MKKYIERSGLRMNNLTKVLILAFLILAGGYLVQKFFQYWNFQSPVTINFRSPIKRVYLYENKMREPLTPTPKPRQQPKNAPILSPTPIVRQKTDREIINSYKHADILWKIYGLESSWGRNDACKNQGKFNGYGYGQNTTSWNCFATFEEVTNKVNAWLDKKLITKDLATSLCIYNLGIDQPNCIYYQKFLSL